MIPDDLHEFLSLEANLLLQWVEPYPVEVEGVVLFGIKELSVQNFKLSTSEYFSNYDEPGEDPESIYDITGIDLIKEIENYSPDGVLIWFPQFAEYGSWDCDHGLITIFPDISWTEIVKDPGKYVNAQWYPERVNHYLLRPWTDKRCADLIPKENMESTLLND